MTCTSCSEPVRSYCRYVLVFRAQSCPRYLHKCPVFTFKMKGRSYITDHSIPLNRLNAAFSPPLPQLHLISSPRACQDCAAIHFAFRASSDSPQLASILLRCLAQIMILFRIGNEIKPYESWERRIELSCAKPFSVCCTPNRRNIPMPAAHMSEYKGHLWFHLTSQGGFERARVRHNAGRTF